MKIGIIGDVHYGASYNLGKKDHRTGSNTRLVDYDSTLIKTIESLAAKGCRYLVFTGDIFEHRTPSVKQQELFSAALRYAVELGIKQIYIVVGNHDQQRITGATTISYIKELPLPNIHVYDEIDMVVVKDDHDKPIANLIFIPFRDRKWFSTESSDLAIQQIDEMVSYCLSSIDNDATKICVGHMAIEGTMWMLDQYVDLYNNSNDLLLPVKMFNSIDITLMGHVHTPGCISKDPLVIYTGSMEKRGAFENHDKKYMIIDLISKKVSSYTEPCRGLHDIDIAFTTIGQQLMEKVKEKIDEYADENELTDSIVRLSLTISAADDKFCSPKELEEYLYKNHNIFHCVEIKPSLIFSRQARDSTINEMSNDSEAYVKYISSAFKDSKYKKDIIKAGLEIIGKGRE
jgi:exonuclease SbcD